MSTKETNNKEEIILKGIAASPGIVIGNVYIFNESIFNVQKKQLQANDIEDEIKRFNNSINITREQLQKIVSKLDDKHARILKAHLLILEDPMLIQETIRRIEDEKLNADYLLVNVLEGISNVFSKMDDEYLKERLADIQDVTTRLLQNLQGKKHIGLDSLDKTNNVIIVAYNLSPSDTAMMHKEKISGFVTDIGGKTSHTAIMARSMEIPAVVGLENITGKAAANDNLIIDGNDGVVIINPSERSIKKYIDLQKKQEKVEKELAKYKDLPACTIDNHTIRLYGNIEFPEEVDSVIEHGAEGIGLYRTEFFFMNREDLPSEEEQLEAFREVAAKMAPKPVTIRTLDLGGDKFISSLNITREMNPFMGLRAIRLCLHHIDIFKSQLRAILRASVLKNLRIMFPMISGFDELKNVKRIFEEVKNDLLKKNIPFDKNIKVGVMIEIPSAAITSDILAKEVDFFSIGTNDLIQYTLAVERANEKVAYLYEPLHPAVLRLIKLTVESAKNNNIEVSMCGEMAGDPQAILILMGLGLKDLSMSSGSIPETKKIIRNTSYKYAMALAEEVFKISSAHEIGELVNSKNKHNLF